LIEVLTLDENARFGQHLQMLMVALISGRHAGPDQSSLVPRLRRVPARNSQRA
jgi:hypothetical protein